MLELAGRVADGVILNLMSPAQAGEAASVVRAAAVAAGRDAAAVEIVCVVHTCLSDDPEAAAAAACNVVPRYILHPSVTRLFGDSASLGAARDSLLAGDRSGAAALVPDDVAAGFVAHGDAHACATRIAEYRQAGIDLPVVFPMPVSGDWGYQHVISALGSRAPAEQEAEPSAAQGAQPAAKSS